MEPLFNEDDLKEITARGIAPEKILEQLDAFKKGFPFVNLQRSCTIGDGIHTLGEKDLERLEGIHSEAASKGRIMKFVPASGAASRMFKILLSVNSRFKKAKKMEILKETEKGDPDAESFLKFMAEIKKFAFYEELRKAMSRDGADIEESISDGDYQVVLDYAIGPGGLNLADLPKGLVPFHRYPGHSRTAFEEHIVEAGAYARDGEGVARVHFTLSPQHEKAVKDHIKEVRPRYEGSGLSFEFSFSSQRPSTDTIAVDMSNNPLRDGEGKLLFRPGGHGALLENLMDLRGDIIFIKNIDNVVPDRLKGITYVYKKALAGFLIELQEKIFGYLKRISDHNGGKDMVQEVFAFIKERLSVDPPAYIMNGNRAERIEYLISRLNRPLRVCGMVRNVAEPGGGPFWVGHDSESASLQIVEKSQVDMSSREQGEIFKSSTHFNPVDLVCGVTDYQGRAFDLRDYVDHETGLITIKSKDGKELKALELPGLWNGSMAYWNTVFVEVPLLTFNPVKSVLDLLRKEHQTE